MSETFIRCGKRILTAWRNWVGGLLLVVGVSLSAVNVFGASSLTRVNLARFQPVITDSVNGTQLGTYITDGLVDDTSSWQSDASGPHWAEVDFPFAVTVGSVQLVMGRDTVVPPTTFWLQYLTNATWVTISGTTFVGNTNKERNIIFSSPVTATAFRFYDSLDGTVYIREMALYPPNDASGFPFGTDFSIDLARKRPVLTTTNSFGSWPLLATDGRISPTSAWKTTLVGSNSLLINLQFTNKIGSAHLYSGMTGVPPLTNFVLQYWTAGAWANIPGGSISGNTSSNLAILFSTPVTTTQVQLLFTNSGISAVQELCIFSANSSTGYSLGTGVITNPPVTLRYDTYTDSYYYLSNSAAGKVVVESNGVPVLGTPSVKDFTTQYQVLLNYDSGTYRLRNRATGLCLAGAQMTTNVGAQLVDEAYSALPDQDWFIQTNGTGFNLVNQYSGLVVDVQGGVLLQNVQTNATSQLWQTSLATIFPKKGGAGINQKDTFNVNWAYNWWINPTAPPQVSYNPMISGVYFAGSSMSANMIQFTIPWRTNAWSLNLMGYNEPDHVDQGNIDATNGAIRWMNLQNMDLPLVGPSGLVTAWLQPFFGYVTNWGLRLDYFSSHQYVPPASGSSSCWVSPAQSLYNTYGVPVWLTEFGIKDWAGNQNWSEEDNYNALAEFVWRAESLTWLRKHSLFIWAAGVTNDVVPPNPWTKYTPGITSTSRDTNGNFTPFGELYAAWDDVANVETNKVYHIHNNGTRKRMQNSLTSLADANNIRINDTSVKWTLQPSPTAGQYYVVSESDGRRLSYVSAGSVNLVAAGTIGTAVQWKLTEATANYGWFYVDNVTANQRLQLAYNNSTPAATFSMVATTTTTTAVQWRFIATLPPPAWTGGATNNAWSAAANWDTSSSPTAGQSVMFNSGSVSNLTTTLDDDFTLSSLTLTTPTGPVSIGGTNTLTLNSGISLASASQNLTITAPMVLGASQSWGVTSARTLSVSGGVSGSGGLTVAGSGKVLLGGTNTYTGGTSVSVGGTLQMGASNALPNGVGVGNVVVSGTLDLNGRTQTVNGLNGSGVVDNTAVGAATLTVGNNDVTTNFTGTIQNIGGALALVKTGLGTLTLTGTNTFSGGFFNNSAGIVNSGNAAGTNNCFGIGPVVLNAGTMYMTYNFTFTNALTLNGGVLRIGGGAGKNMTWAGPVAVTADSTIQCDGTTAGITISGAVTNAGFTLSSAPNGTANTISGPISGSGTIMAATYVNGTLNLNAANTFSGSFRATNGTLKIGNANAMQNGTVDMNAADTGTVNLNNLNAVLGALTGSRALALGSGAVSIGNNGASTTFSGALSGVGSFTKIGAGTLTVSGTNTYSGRTMVSSGTLALSGNGSLASTNITVAGGARLDVSGLSSTFALGSTRTLTNSSLGAVMNGANNCSAGILSLVTDGLNPSFIQTNGAMTISAGTVIRVNNTGAILSSGSYPLIASATTGNPGLVAGALPPVLVTGNGAVATTSLQFNGAGGLDLVVASTIATNSTNISFTVSNGTLTLTWPGDHLGWIAQSNSVNLANTNFWFDISGSQSDTNLVIPIGPANPNVFYRLRSPN